MIIKLGEPNSSHYFKYKIGDNVRSKLGATNGVVISGHCSDSEVFYVIKYKSPNVMTCIYKQENIELILE